MATATNNNVEASYIYAADFGNKRISVFDGNFKHVTWLEQKIARIPVPENYAPYNVQNLGGNLYVAIAKRGSNGRDEAGAGLGEVAVITPKRRSRPGA